MIEWSDPPEYNCHGCGANVEGALGNGHFGELTSSLPPGWRIGCDARVDPKVIYFACSAQCATKIEGGAPA